MATIKAFDEDSILWTLFLSFFFFYGLFIVIFFFGYLIKLFIEFKKENFLSKYNFPNELNIVLEKKFSHLHKKEILEILLRLREYFAFLLTLDEPSFVPMPSFAVGFAYTSFMELKEYPDFVKILFGDDVFINPPFSFDTKRSCSLQLFEVEKQSNLGVHLWSEACLREGLDCYNPKVLPSLYCIDSKLKILFGFTYCFNEDKLMYVIPLKYTPTISKLKKEIKTSMKKGGESKQKLLTRLHYFLGNYDFCHQYYRSDLDKIFRIIEKYPSLVLGIYENDIEKHFKWKALEYAQPNPNHSVGGFG